jgi:phage terminase large subunit
VNRAEARAYLASLSPEKALELNAIIARDIKAKQAIAKLRDLRKWTPRRYQQGAWDYLAGGGKRACLIWHRRSGKDDVALNWAAEAAHERVGEYWHLLPEAAQGRKAIWDAVSPHTGIRRIDQAFPLAMRARTREQEMAIQFQCGSVWRVVGSDNYNSLVGSSPVGVVFSEWALADPQAWAFIRPILIENGGWAMFITTPRGTNHAKTTLDLAKKDDSWFWEVLSADKTKVFTEDQLADELREMQFEYGPEEGAALFEQEYNCSFESALLGSYYGAYLTRLAKLGRIGTVHIDRAVLTHTGWDLGISDATAIWFVQCVGKERRLVDYVETSGVGLDEYARILEAKRVEHGWTYGFHYFPHDIAHRELANNGLSRVDTLRNLGVRATVVPQSHVQDGINATRRLLDTAWIDEKRCERGLNALRNYQRAWNEKMKTFSDAPMHNWASHGADALRTFASGYRDPKEVKKFIPLPNFSGDPRERATGWMAR